MTDDSIGMTMTEALAFEARLRLSECCQSEIKDGICTKCNESAKPLSERS